MHQKEQTMEMNLQYGDGGQELLRAAHGGRGVSPTTGGPQDVKNAQNKSDAGGSPSGRKRRPADDRQQTGSATPFRRRSAFQEPMFGRCSCLFFFVWNGFAESGCPARRAVGEELPFSGLICATIRNFGGC